MFIEPIIIFLASIMPFNEQQANTKPKEDVVKEATKTKLNKDKPLQPTINPLYRGGWDRN